MEQTPDGDREGAYTPEFKASLRRGLNDAKHGRIHSMAEVKKQLGIKH